MRTSLTIVALLLVVVVALTGVAGFSNAESDVLRPDSALFAPAAQPTPRPGDPPVFGAGGARAGFGDLRALIDAWLAAGDTSFRWDGDALVVTATYSESDVNAMAGAALSSAAYDVRDVAIDLVAGGAIARIYGPGLGTPVTEGLTVEVQLAASEGGVVLDLVSATLNGRRIPQAALDEIERLLANLADGYMMALARAYGVSYSVDGLTITDQEVTVQLTVRRLEG